MSSMSCTLAVMPVPPSELLKAAPTSPATCVPCWLSEELAAGLGSSTQCCGARQNVPGSLLWFRRAGTGALCVRAGPLPLTVPQSSVCALLLNPNPW